MSKNLNKEIRRKLTLINKKKNNQNRNKIMKIRWKLKNRIFNLNKYNNKIKKKILIK